MERVGCSTERLLRLPSILNVLQLFCGLVATACAGAALSCTLSGDKKTETSLSYSKAEAYGQGWVLFVGSICIIITFALWLTDITNFRRVQMPDKWTQIAFFYTIAAIILYVIAFAVEAFYASSFKAPTALYHSCYYGTWQASAAFAFFTLLLYIGGLVQIIRSRHAA